MDLVATHQMSTWDAAMFAASADAGCRLLLSEDLQEGFTWSGVTAVNPFARPLHPLLETALARSQPEGGAPALRTAAARRSPRRLT